jgi:transcriptional regulator with XRE-family HTH domain
MAKRGRKPTKIPPDWAQRITQARGGLSQEQLGALIGRSQQSINGYESGGPEPTLAIYRAIARVTGADLAWLIFGKEGSGDTLAGIAIKANEDNRVFAWAFHEATKLFAEEGIQADFAYVLSYTRKLLGSLEKASNDTEAKEAIQRTLETDRAEFRKDLDQIRKNRL